MPLDWKITEQRAARWANVIALLPAFYCGYSVWQQRNNWDLTAKSDGGFIFSVIMFLACIALGGVLNFARRGRSGNESVITIADHAEELRRIDKTHKAEMWRAEEVNRQISEEKRLVLLELQKTCEEFSFLTSLQIDAIKLASELFQFVKNVGEPPMPKYTREQIDNMSLIESRRLIDAGDGDYADACEYHFGEGKIFSVPALTFENTVISRMNRLGPFYYKVKAGYELEFAEKIEKIKKRFVLEGIVVNALSLPVDGKDGIKNINAMALSLWALSGAVAAKAF